MLQALQGIQVDRRERFWEIDDRLERVGEAAALVRQAGGVAAWAHPPYDASKDDLRELQRLGVEAVEVDFPSCPAGRGRVLRGWATELGMSITGGSDCHGPDEPSHAVGACSVTWDELTALRALARVA
jgi:hypothetical protein